MEDGTFMTYDVIIVGGGPAGFTAALYASRASLKTLLIERFFSGGQMATTEIMENYPGFEQPINGLDLAMQMEAQAKRFGAEVVFDEVTEVDLEGDVKTVKTAYSKFQGKTVILSMGASPRALGVKGEGMFKGRGVSYCATCDGALFKDEEVAIIGGGDTAVEDANYLSRMCKKVYIVHRRDELRAVKVLQEKAFNNPKIEIVWDSVPDGILGNDTVEKLIVKNVKSEDLTTLNVAGVFVAIGSKPNTKLVAEKIKMSDYGYILTDEYMKTNIPGVFACGDIREKPLRQVVTAASDGAIAAFFAEKHIEGIE